MKRSLWVSLLTPLATPTKNQNHDLLKRILAQATDYQALLSEKDYAELYPEQRGASAPLSLDILPTPVIHCTQLEKIFPHQKIYCKNDGRNGSNKLRKLAYLLADAQASGATTIFTFGCVGSNQTTLTAAYGKKMGFDVVCFLRDQAPSDVVQRNLLIQQSAGADMRHCLDRIDQQKQAYELFLELINKGKPAPSLIPVGGSSARGTVGAVQAAFELMKQITQKELPAPDRIYVPLGSGGTAAGLILGCKLAGIPTHIVAVLVEPETDDSPMQKKLEGVFYDTLDFLRSNDTSIPALALTDKDYSIARTLCGTDYGIPTPESKEAQTIFALEGIPLDDTYSSKCLAALIDDIRSDKYTNQTLLFWNTFTHDMSRYTGPHTDYRHLAYPFHRYFISLLIVLTSCLPLTTYTAASTDISQACSELTSLIKIATAIHLDPQETTAEKKLILKEDLVESLRTQKKICSLKNSSWSEGRLLVTQDILEKTKQQVLQLAHEQATVRTNNESILIWKEMVRLRGRTAFIEELFPQSPSGQRE